MRNRLLLSIIACASIGLPQLTSAATYDFRIYAPGIRATAAVASAPSTWASCAAILAAKPGSASGSYTLTINGSTVNTYCDMTTEGGGWTLVGNQVPTAVGWTETTGDINAANFGSLTSSWRYGNSHIQSITPTVAWRITVDSGGLSYTEADYFKPTCVISWAQTWNGTSSNSMPQDCQIAYTSSAFTATVSAHVANNASAGIGQNNNGAYCSVRFAADPTGNPDEAYSCSMSTAGHMELWAK